MTQDQEGVRQIDLPYANVLPKLLERIMAVQLLFVRSIDMHKSVDGGVEAISDAEINDHFKWLLKGGLGGLGGTKSSRFGAGGCDRHLFLSPYPNSEAIAGLREAFGAKRRGNPTRISCLIRGSFKDCEYHEQKKIPGKSEFTGASIRISSPIRIARDLLTDPDAPGMGAYVDLTIRSYLFEMLGVFPDFSVGWDESSSEASGLQKFVGKLFGVDDVTVALGRVWTSFRPRRDSAGMDPISPRGRENGDAIVRAWLTLRGEAVLYFKDAIVKNEKGVIAKGELTRGVDNCIRYLSDGVFDSGYTDNSYSVELQKSQYIKELPDPGVIVNQLFGIPIPIRGADVLFRGGIKFPESGGLVIAIHGEPGAGKTSIALGLSAHLSPFGIKTFFITADGKRRDLQAKISQMISDRTRRLSFFPSDEEIQSFIYFEEIKPSDLVDEETPVRLIEDIRKLSERMEGSRNVERSFSEIGAPLPCSGIVVLDGLHDLLVGNGSDSIRHLYDLIAALRSLKLLVIVTSGRDWKNNARLDYLVDISIELGQEHIDEYGAKPDRRLILSKTRHQLSALGKHGFRLDGDKGVRFSPQINYRLEDRFIYEPRLPDVERSKKVLSIAATLDQREYIRSINESVGRNSGSVRFSDVSSFINIFPGSHILINGRGSSGKAGLALKIACAPAFKSKYFNADALLKEPFVNVLVASFLYSQSYYDLLHKRIIEYMDLEFRSVFGVDSESKMRVVNPDRFHLKVIHFYPGHLRPNDFFNRIEWEIESARLNGVPYTAIVIDGLHNVPIQFPELEKHSLVWPQLFDSFRSRDVTVISTHTTLVVPDAEDPRVTTEVDDRRSEPLRHALVQRVDFQLQIDPFNPYLNLTSEEHRKMQEIILEYNIEDLFSVRVLTAIHQNIPHKTMLWSRSQLVLFEDPRYEQNKQLSLRV
ncbi:MAG: hypothetical protein K9H25_19230 [Rhodospirillum sp.]|nr:hypothetical protein [Rhodospirillum sp.]MCF8491241.1 hypothetical protein [Rhodospirillum sp.]